MKKKKKHEEMKDASAFSEEAGELTEEAMVDDDNAVEMVEEELGPMEALRAERNDLFARLQRLSADYQNHIKRNQQQQGETIAFAKADVLRAMLPVLDHFDHALATEAVGEEAKGLYDGVKIVRDEFLRILEQLGIERIDVEVGDVFDPHLHQAILQQAVDGVEANHVSLVMQRGYVYGKRTLRPAKVGVAPGIEEAVEKTVDEDEIDKEEA